MPFTNSLEIIEMLLTIWICFNKNINYALLKSFKACYTPAEMFNSNNNRVVYFFITKRFYRSVMGIGLVDHLFTQFIIRLMI